MLPWNQSEPGCQIATLVKCAAVTDRGNQRCCGEWTDAGWSPPRQASRRPAEPAGPDLEQAKARFRHYEDQLVARYGHGLDPSKADRLIAESMAKTGISEEQIAGALRDLSRHGRDNGPLTDEAYCSRVATQATRQMHQTRTVKQPRMASRDIEEHSME